MAVLVPGGKAPVGRYVWPGVDCKQRRLGDSLGQCADDQDGRRFGQ